MEEQVAPLLRFANAIGRSVIDVDPETMAWMVGPGANGACGPIGPIYISGSLCGESLPAVLAHEIGHALDFADARVAYAFTGIRYRQMRGLRPSLAERAFLYRMEEVAFENGWAVIRKLGAPVDRRVFDRAAEGCLAFYRKAFGLVSP